MNGLYAAAVEIQEFCESSGWRFCFIGGLALIRWGDPRQTLDVDLTLLTGFRDEPAIASALATRFKPRRPDAVEFALANRVVLISGSNGVPIDVSLGALPYEVSMIERASRFDYLPNVALMTASAEDLLILKVFAGREKDWVDVENIIIRQTGKLDWDLIWRELEPLCELKEAPELVERLRQIRSTIDP